jgi:hypothetical protein
VSTRFQVVLHRLWGAKKEGLGLPNVDVLRLNTLTLVVAPMAALWLKKALAGWEPVMIIVQDHSRNLVYLPRPVGNETSIRTAVAQVST